MNDKTKNEVEILFPDEAEQVEPDLPPAGHARDEVLAERKDALEEEGERKYDELGRESIDPKAFKPDRELQHQIVDLDMLTVDGAVLGFIYCWTFTGKGGYFVWAKKAKHWEVVQGNMPECKHAMVAEDTTRRIGDVILMRTTEENYDRHEEREALKRVRQSEGVTAELREIGGRYPRTFIVHDNLSDLKVGGRSLSDIMQAKAEHKTATRTAARRVAAQSLDPKIREGTVLGVQMPR